MVEAYDLEIGPIQRTFEELFKRIGGYFQSALVEPKGRIVETDLSTYSQKPLQQTLTSLLNFYGFSDLPNGLRINLSEDSQISGIHRSDNITTYEERIKDGSLRTYNFYSKYGPENMKASFYWFNKNIDNEEIHGILTEDDRWYLRIKSDSGVYYLRMEKTKSQ
ncbi:hypothetical protein ACFL25_01250 [Patescibacteria group bacterium]